MEGSIVCVRRTPQGGLRRAPRITRLLEAETPVESGAMRAQLLGDPPRYDLRVCHHVSRHFDLFYFGLSGSMLSAYS
jgi:hypothetical protein